MAVEPEPYLRARAVVAAAGAGVGVTVRVMDGCAEAVPAGDGTFDAAVVSLVLCSVSDLAAALNELSRVLGPVDGSISTSTYKGRRLGCDGYNASPAPSGARWPAGAILDGTPLRR